MTKINKIEIRVLTHIGLLLGGFCVATTMASPVLADEHTLGTMKSKGQRYEVAVETQPEVPVVGLVHFTVKPIETKDSAPVLGAQIEIIAHKPDGRPAYRSPAINTPADRSRYDANITFPSAGVWTLVVGVSDEHLGEEHFSFKLPLVETELTSGLMGTLVWLLTFTTLISGGSYLAYRSRQLQTRAART